MKKLKLNIDGMHCASCVSNIERSVKKVDGVKTVAVSLLTKKAIVDADDSVSIDALKVAVGKAGYKVKSVENA